MAKITIGTFYSSCRQRSYLIFARPGYRKCSKNIYVGNSAYGIFFRFPMHGENIYISQGVGRQPKELYIPTSDNDLKVILDMILIPRGFKDITILKRFNRKELIEREIVNAI